MGGACHMIVMFSYWHNTGVFVVVCEMSRVGRKCKTEQNGENQNMMLWCVVAVGAAFYVCVSSV